MSNAQRLPPLHLLRDRVLPIAAIESVRLESGEIDAVEATDVDIDLIRIGARNVERMDAAGGAEGMARRAGVEPVSGQRILAADEFERVGRDDEMQKAFLAAHRTIAFGHARKIAGHAKAHAPAMTASFVVLQRHLSPIMTALVPVIDVLFRFDRCSNG